MGRPDRRAVGGTPGPRPRPQRERGLAAARRTAEAVLCPAGQRCTARLLFGPPPAPARCAASFAQFLARERPAADPLLFMADWGRLADAQGAKCVF